MRLYLIIILLLFFSFASYGQYSLSAQVGVATSFDGPTFNLLQFGGPSNTYTKSITGGITFLSRLTHTVHIGATMYFQQYKLVSTNGGGTGLFNTGDKVLVNNTSDYLCVAPVLDVRFSRIFYFDVQPSLGILLSGNETTTVNNSNPENTSSNINKVVLQFVFTLREQLSLNKEWKFIISENSGIMPTPFTTVGSGDDITPATVSIQIGIMRKYRSK